MEKHFENTVSSDAIIEADIIRQIIFRRAEEIMVGKEALEVTPIAGLDYKFQFPDQVYFDPTQIAEGSKAGYSNLTWTTVSGSLNKYQTRVLLTDEVNARQQGNTQYAFSLDAAAKGMAMKMDTDIFTALTNGAALTTAAGAKWNAAAADPASDIAAAIAQMLDNTYMTDSDIANIKLFYPAKLFGYLSKPVEIGEIQQTLRNWAEREFQISLFPTRQLTTSAIACVKSQELGFFLEHDGSKIPGAEQWREVGEGDGYLITKYYKPVIVPYASGYTTSKYACTITTVA